MSDIDELEKFIKRIEKSFKSIEEHVTRLIRDEFARIYEDIASMERMFKPMWHHEGYLEPLYTIKDLGDRIVIYIDLPYAHEGTIDVKFIDNKMIIKAKLKQQISLSQWGTRFSDITFNEYRTVIDLPLRVDPDKVKIRTRRGVVEITIYK